VSEPRGTATECRNDSRCASKQLTSQRHASVRVRCIDGACANFPCPCVDLSRSLRSQSSMRCVGYQCRSLALRQCGTWRRPQIELAAGTKLALVGTRSGDGKGVAILPPLRHAWAKPGIPAREPAAAPLVVRVALDAPSNDLRVKCDAEHAGRRHVLEATLALAPNWKRLTAPEPFRRYSARRKLTSLTSQKPSLVQFA